MSEPEKRKRGRPVGSGGNSRFTAVRSFRFTPEDLAELQELARGRRTTEAEALRQAVREALEADRNKRGAE